jgi:hypothetical protein
VRNSVGHTLALLRNQRQETAGRPCPAGARAPHEIVHLAARTRGPVWPRVAVGVGLALGATLLCLLLLGGGRREAPTLTIVTPTPKSTLPAGDVTVVVEVTGAKLAEGGAANRYHIHYYLDISPPTALGGPATTAPGTWSSTAGTSYVWKNLAPGTHILYVELVRGNDTPLNPAVTASVSVRLVSSSPEPALPPSPTTPRPPSRGS